MLRTNELRKLYDVTERRAHANLITRTLTKWSKMSNGIVYFLQICLVFTITVSKGQTKANNDSKLKQCSGGICCENGRFQILGAVCRAKQDDCDLAEFCTGNLSSCPPDKHVNDRGPCQENRGRCFKGRCHLSVRAKGGELSAAANDRNVRRYPSMAVDQALVRRKASASQSRLEQGQKIQAKERFGGRHSKNYDASYSNNNKSMRMFRQPDGITPNRSVRSPNKAHLPRNRDKANDPTDKTDSGFSSKFTDKEESQLEVVLTSVLCSVVVFAGGCVFAWAWYTRQCCFFEEKIKVDYEPLILMDKRVSKIDDPTVHIDVGQH